MKANVTIEMTPEELRSIVKTSILNAISNLQRDGHLPTHGAGDKPWLRCGLFAEIVEDKAAMRDREEFLDHFVKTTVDHAAARALGIDEED